jgi:signal transduction histidine kinase
VAGQIKRLPSVRSRLTVVAGSLTVVFLTLTVLIVGLSWGTQSALKRQNYDDNGLAAVQLRIYYESLIAEIRGLRAAPDSYDVKTAVLNYDILYERLQSLPTRPPYPEFLDDDIRNLARDAFARLSAMAPAFDAAGAANSAAPLLGLAPALEALRPAIERVASRTVQLASDFRGRKRQDSLESVRWLVIAVGGLMLSSAAFAILMWRSLRIEQTQMRELAVARDQAVRANRAKSDFLARMSHDLRTPLNAIIGFSDMIRNETFGALNDRYVEYATHVKGAGEHLLHLIGELLDLSRIEAKKTDLFLEPVRFNGIVDDCLGLIDSRAAAKTLTVSAAVETGTLTYRVDAAKVRQMILNLLDNAVKFSPDRGTITVALSDAPGGGLDVTVRDEGPGIPEHDIAKVLEPFAQSDLGDSMIAKEGSGLGLPIVKGLIEAHGGSLRLDTRPGAGTAVVLTFPERLRVVDEDDDGSDDGTAASA